MKSNHATDRVTGLLSKSVSVVICCYNSSARLGETLRHLANQHLQHETWEIIVVDNASTDDTAALVSHFGDEHPELSLRVVSEPNPGQTYARLRGLKESQHEVILFVDDDNWLNPDYLTIVAKTMSAHPEIAALGGISTAVYEEPPPEWMARHRRWYAVSGLPDEDEGELIEVDFLWGAGTAFRRNALEQIVKEPFRLPGRRGKALPAGDDNELCCRLLLCGQKLFRHSGLRFQHYLPAARTQWSYLRRLHYAAGEASVLLDVYRINSPGATRRWPSWIVRSWYAQLCNVFWQLLRHPLVLLASLWKPMEGDDRILHIEIFRGRYAALKRSGSKYRRMLDKSNIVESRCARCADQSR